MEPLYQGFATAFPLETVSRFGRDLLIIISFALIFNLTIPKPDKGKEKVQRFCQKLKSNACKFFS